MKRFALTVFALVLSMAAASAAAELRGVVMTREGVAIAKAKVSVYALETQAASRLRLQSETPQRVPIATAETSSSGAFKLAFDAPAANLQIEASGFAPDGLRVVKDEDIGAVPLTPGTLKTGTVRSGGKPVEGARVVWTGRRTIEWIAITDAEGRYSIPDPDKWAARVTVIHPDHAIDSESVMPPETKIAIDRKLAKGEAIEGRVVAADGKTPVSGAAIHVDGWKLGTSGEDGAFSIAHAPAKWQEVRAVSESMSAAASKPKGELILRLAKTPRITGVVRDAQAKLPVAGAEVAAIPTQSDFVARAIGRASGASAITDAKGTFSIDVDAGNYELMVWMPGYEFTPADVSLASGATADRALPGTKLARVTGRVIDDENRPVAAAWITPSADGGRTGRGRPMRTLQTGATVSGPDGAWVMRAAGIDDPYGLDATKKGYPTGKAPAFKLSSGETKTGVVITVPRGIEVTGLVTDSVGSPVSGVSVTASEADRGGPGRFAMRMVLGESAAPDEVETGSDGRFTMRLAEGKYTVLFRREGFAPYNASSVDVRPGVAPVEVTLQPGAEIAGRVVRAGGSGIEGVMVGSVMGGVPSSATTGPDGSFVLKDLAPGSAMVMVRKPEEFIQLMRNVTAPASNITIEVPKGESVTGRVVDKSSGKPVTEFSAGVSGESSGGGMRIMMQPVLKTFRSDDGSFQLEGLPIGPVQLIVSAPGYVQYRVPGLVLEEGKPVRDLEIALETGTKISGKVTGPDGKPVSGVTVGQRRPQGAGPAGPGGGASTDAEGNYQLEAVEPGEKTITFNREGYPAVTKTVNVSGRELKLDVQLGRGATIAGVVVTEGGSPVAGARVYAQSATSGWNEAMSDANGNFRLEGVAEGRYSIAAQKSGYVDGEIEDVDAMTAGNLRLVLGQGGRITGRVIGLQASEYAQVRVSAYNSTSNANATPDSSGSFTIEGAPTGTVRVSASKGMGFGGSGQTTEAKTVELQPGGEAMVDLEFRTDKIVTGRVTHNGAALEGATVRFTPKNPSVQTRANATTDSSGRYEARGLEDGEYDLTVFNASRMSAHSETRSVSNAATIDVDIVSATLRGRVTDADTGQAIAGARISFDPKKAPAMGAIVRRMAESDTAGNFLLDDVSPGSYSARAEKDGYGQDVRDLEVTQSGADGIDFKIAKIDGLRLRVVDARSGTALGAQVRITDGLGRTAYEGGVSSSTDGSKISLAMGSYRVSVWADGYAPIVSGVSSPSSGTTLALTPGGTIELELDGGEAASGKLIGADGQDYFRGYWMRQASFRIDPGVTTLRNITPGSYTLAMLDAAGNVTKSWPVSVTEGRTTRAKVSR